MYLGAQTHLQDGKSSPTYLHWRQQLKKLDPVKDYNMNE